MEKRVGAPRRENGEIVTPVGAYGAAKKPVRPQNGKIGKMVKSVGAIELQAGKTNLYWAKMIKMPKWLIH